MEREIKIILGVAKKMIKLILKKNSIDGTKRKNVEDMMMNSEENLEGIQITKKIDINVKENGNMNKKEGDKNNNEMKKNILEEKIMKKLIILEIMTMIREIKNRKNKIKVIPKLF